MGNLIIKKQKERQPPCSIMEIIIILMVGNYILVINPCSLKQKKPRYIAGLSLNSLKTTWNYFTKLIFNSSVLLSTSISMCCSDSLCLTMILWQISKTLQYLSATKKVF